MRPPGRKSFIVVAGFVAGFGCGQAKSPANEDACARDDDCTGGLMCCHAGVDAPKGVDVRRVNERGFCVKQSVCADVAPPPPPTALPE